ncbi:MAG TPA: Pycsar system effector family protein [Terriglobales bacterium]|nr:Pycsar system effector family protein [Terriglobales bacterium]
MESHDFASHVHNYLSQFILAADQKAAFTLAASSAVLGFLISRLSDDSHLHSLCFWLPAILAALLLMTAAGLAAIAVRPRQNGIKSGLVAWGGILKSANADEYVASVDKADRLSEVLGHCYTLSVIVRRKYALLKCAIDFFIVGSAVTILFLVIAAVERHAHP